MNLEQLKYIKNVSDPTPGIWAYEKHGKGTYFPLTFRVSTKESSGVDTHAKKLPKGSLIVLSQRYKNDDKDP
ncbi:MAG: hypothetical protein WBC73_18000, partial [Phormidesmis sp.]